MADDLDQFNVFFNIFNLFFNPNIIFTKDMMGPVFGGLLPYEINIAENKGDTTIFYDFIINGI